MKIVQTTAKTTTQTTLYSYRAEELTLKDSITACQQQLEGAIALLYSPNACQFLRLKGITFENSSGEKLDNFDRVFEARIFNNDWELRWLNRDRGTGQAILLSETELKQSINHFSKLPAEDVEFLVQHYLLWGKKASKTPAQPGWQRLAEARIGKLDIPIDSEISDRVYLKTCEYLAAVGEYGNFAVIEERLVGLEVK